MLLGTILEKDRKDKLLDIFASNLLYDAPLKTLAFGLARKKANLRHIFTNELLDQDIYTGTYKQMYKYYMGLMIDMHDKDSL